MSSMSFITLLFVLTSISLVILSLVNRRQIRTRVVNQKLQQMRRRIDELEALSATIGQTVESNKISKVITDETIEVLNKMLKIAPDSAFCHMHLENTKKRADELNHDNQQTKLFRLMESDAAIARAQLSLQEAARIVRKRLARNQLQAAETDRLIQELSWANLMVKVISHVGQGHKATNSGDVARASAYYRKALEVATETQHKDERQNQIITELGEMLNHKRKALSLSLMPENTYNPDNNTPIARACSR